MQFEECARLGRRIAHYHARPDAIAGAGRDASHPPTMSRPLSIKRSLHAGRPSFVQGDFDEDVLNRMNERAARQDDAGSAMRCRHPFGIIKRMVRQGTSKAQEPKWPYRAWPTPSCPPSTSRECWHRQRNVRKKAPVKTGASKSFHIACHDRASITDVKPAIRSRAAGEGNQWFRRRRPCNWRSRLRPGTGQSREP